jgi:hypothetical protein
MSDDLSADAARGERRGIQRERQRARRFGWTSLFAWVLFGLALEAAHGFKLSAYLDDGLRRNLLRLAHAHGVILALIVLAHGELGGPILAAAAASSAAAPHDAMATVRRVGQLFRASALAIPLGFAVSALGASESDPSPAIALVPMGALGLLAALGRTAWAAWRRPSEHDPPRDQR